VAAILFMVTSLGLTFIGRQKDVSVMKGAGKPPVSQTVPAAPAKPEALPPATPAPENPPAAPAK
jgi:hypothetical protein